MSNYLNFSVTDKNELKSYVLKKLGAPLVTVELTDDQLDSCIDDAVELFTRYAGYNMDYLIIDLNDYVEGVGIKLPSNVLAIRGLDSQNLSSGGHTTLFTIENAMWNMGMWPDFSRMISQGGSAFVSYELAMQYLDLIKRYRGKGFDFNYTPQSQMLKLFPDPKRREIVGNTTIVTAYTMHEEQYAYGMDWVKRSSLAEAKILLGTIRGKFNNVQLLGGGSLESTSLKSEGITERDKLIDDLKAKEGPTMGFFVG